MKGLYFNDNNAFSTLHYRRKHELAENADRLPRDAMHKRGLCRHAVSVCVWGGAENDGQENDGQGHCRGWKMQDWN